LWVFVVDFHFQGTSARALDAKGRLGVPARHREVLRTGCESLLTIPRHPDGSPRLFPRLKGETFPARPVALPFPAGRCRPFLRSTAHRHAAAAAAFLQQPMPAGLQDLSF